MVDNDDKKYQECLQIFERYFPSWNREDGCIKKIKEDLARIKQISDLRKRYKEVSFVWKKHRDDEIYVSGKYFDGELDMSFVDTIEKYRELIKELNDLRDKTLEEKNNKANNKPIEREREREQFIL